MEEQMHILLGELLKASTAYSEELEKPKRNKSARARLRLAQDQAFEALTTFLKKYEAHK